MGILNIEKIKLELVARSRDMELPAGAQNTDPIEALTNKLGSMSERAEVATMKMTDILNEILMEEDIGFRDEAEKNEFLAEIKPTFSQILNEKLGNIF